jgi:hypothetical protein
MLRKDLNFTFGKQHKPVLISVCSVTGNPNFDLEFSKKLQSKYRTWIQNKSDNSPESIPKLNSVIVRLNALHVLDKGLRSICITPAGVEWLKSMVADSETSDIQAKNKQGNSALDLARTDEEILCLLKLKLAGLAAEVSLTEKMLDTV